MLPPETIFTTKFQNILCGQKDNGIFAKKTKCFGRIYTVNPADIERYYLRILLLHVKGPQSFDDIRTVDVILCNSFQHAVEKLHLTINDAEWKECLQEAVIYQSCGQHFKMHFQKIFRSNTHNLNPTTLHCKNWNFFLNIMADLANNSNCLRPL